MQNGEAEFAENTATFLTNFDIGVAIFFNAVFFIFESPFSLYNFVLFFQLPLKQLSKTL